MWRYAYKDHYNSGSVSIAPDNSLIVFNASSTKGARTLFVLDKNGVLLKKFEDIVTNEMQFSTDSNYLVMLTSGHRQLRVLDTRKLEFIYTTRGGFESVDIASDSGMFAAIMNGMLFVTGI